MPKHRDIELKISSICDNHYDKDDLKSVESHISFCQSCRKFKKDVQALSEILKRWKEISFPRDLEKNINSLPKNQKEAITMLEYHKLSYEKISKIINCPASKVPQIIYKTRKKLLSKNLLLIFLRTNIQKILLLLVIIVFSHIAYQIIKNERTVKYIMEIGEKRDQIDDFMQTTMNISSNETIKISFQSGSSSENNSVSPDTSQKKSSKKGFLKNSLNTVNFVKPFKGELIDTKTEPISSFPFNIKTFSYHLVEQFIRSERLPPQTSVRIEEMINSFSYNSPTITDKKVSLSVEIAPCPWNKNNYLMLTRIDTKKTDNDEVLLFDSKIKLIFDPEAIKSYYLLGYDHYRPIRGTKVNDFKKGEDVLSNFSLIVLYELVPNNININIALKDHLTTNKPVVTISFAYRDKIENVTEDLSYVVFVDHFKNHYSEDFLFAASVAEFALILKDSPMRGDASFEHILASAKESQGNDISRQRSAFIKLVEKTQKIFLSNNVPPNPGK